MQGAVRFLTSIYLQICRGIFQWKSFFINRLSFDRIMATSLWPRVFLAHPVLLTVTTERTLPSLSSVRSAERRRLWRSSSSITWLATSTSGEGATGSRAVRRWRPWHTKKPSVSITSCMSTSAHVAPDTSLCKRDSRRRQLRGGVLEHVLPSTSNNVFFSTSLWSYTNDDN